MALLVSARRPETGAPSASLRGCVLSASLRAYSHLSTSLLAVAICQDGCIALTPHFRSESATSTGNRRISHIDCLEPWTLDLKPYTYCASNCSSSPIAARYFSRVDILTSAPCSIRLTMDGDDFISAAICVWLIPFCFLRLARSRAKARRC